MKKTGFMILALILAVALLVPFVAQAGQVSACGEEGCTPGYWKQPQHFDSWVGYDPSDDFDTLFGIDAFDPDVTLLEALELKGGKFNSLARHAVAALLNAANPDVDYPLSESEIIALVQCVDAGSDWESVKDTLEGFNESGCPLD